MREQLARIRTLQHCTKEVVQDLVMVNSTSSGVSAWATYSHGCRTRDPDSLLCYRYLWNKVMCRTPTSSREERC